MAKDDDKSLGDQHTFVGGEKRVESSQQSLGDQATFGGGDASSMSELDGLVVAADLDMEIVDLATRYTIEETLGKGGMGEVLLATDMRLKRKVAIKRILGTMARSQIALSRFSTEAQSIAALNHSNIVQIHDYGRDEDGPFLIMEYVAGGSLLEKCREGALELEEAVELTCQLCDGLGKAHAANIIHRDVKPANVLLTADGVPKLTDFGLAKDEAADTGMTMTGAVLGTLDFMSPEQRRDAALTDSRSDLWSLAAMLYQMVTGEPPRVIDLDAVPGQLRKCLAQALKSRKDDRYQTARDLRDALKASLTESAPSPPLPSGELGAGECPRCHTKNEASRKFCCECAASLRTSCLKCELEIPAWDKICGECGGKQADLVVSRLEKLQQQRGQAEQLRSEYAYEAALRIVEEVVAIDDERLLEHRPWAEEFLGSTKAEWEREEDSARKHFEESQEHRDAFDYNAAIHAIQSIPDPMRSSVMVSHLQDLESDQKESHELIRTIGDRVKCRDLDGLLVQVDRAVKLQGNREDLHKLQGQLHDREAKLTQQRNKTYSRASELLAEGKAKSAFSLIKKVQNKQLTNLQNELRNALEKMVAAEEELSTLVQEAKADGIIEPEEVVALLPKAIECLELNPNHAGIRQLREDLLARAKDCPAGVLAKLSKDIRALLPVQLDDSSGRKSRKTLKQQLRGVDGEQNVSCKYCTADVKAKNMIRHFDKNHSREGKKSRETLKQQLRGAR